MHCGVPRLIPVCVTRRPQAAGLRHSERNAKVGDHRLSGLQQHILRLEIPVDHAVLVGVVERPRHRACQAHGLVHRRLLLARCQASSIVADGGIADATIRSANSRMCSIAIGAS